MQNLLHLATTITALNWGWCTFSVKGQANTFSPAVSGSTIRLGHSQTKAATEDPGTNAQGEVPTIL